MARSNWEPRSQSGAQSVRSLEVTMVAGATVIFDTKNAGWEFGPVGWDITTAAGATLTCFGSNRAVRITTVGYLAPSQTILYDPIKAFKITKLLLLLVALCV